VSITENKRSDLQEKFEGDFQYVTWIEVGQLVCASRTEVTSVKAKDAEGLYGELKCEKRG